MCNRNTDMFMRMITTKLWIVVAWGRRKGYAVCSHEGVCRGLQLFVTLYLFSHMVVILYFFSVPPIPTPCICVCWKYFSYKKYI